MKHRYLKIAAAIVIVWFVFIWVKYHFAYKNPSIEEIQEEFRKENLTAPEEDSIQMRGYSIHYLTNNLNDNVEGDELGYKNPYLVLLHDAGKNSTNFLEYFKDRELNQKFHIIAIDRIGFGKSHFIEAAEDEEVDYNYYEKKEFGEMADVVTRSMVAEILDDERHHFEEVRIVSEGKSAMAGILGYQSKYLSFSKLMMFNGSYSGRFFTGKLLSNLVSAFSFLFPRPFVSKHKDLIFLDKFKENEKFENLIDFGDYAKKSEMESQGFIYKSEKTEFEPWFFYGTSKSDKKRIRSVVGENAYIFEKESFDVYKNPQKLMDKIRRANRYTMSIHWIE